MITQDVLYLSIAFGFIVLTAFVSFAAFQLAVTLKSLRQVLDSVGDISKDIEAVKNQIKTGVLTAFLTGLNIFLKKRGR